MPTVESLQQAIDRVHGLAGIAGYQDKQAHVFAVVLECTLPRRTRGTGELFLLQQWMLL